MNLAKLLLEKEEQYANKPAIIFEGQPYTYYDLKDTVKSYSNLLNWLGVKKEDPVAIQLPKCMEFIFLHLAALSLGAVTLPLNPAYSREEVEYFLEDSGSKILFVDEEIIQSGRFNPGNISGLRVVIRGTAGPSGLDCLLKKAQKHRPASFHTYPTGPGDTGLLCYTSGTTGQPKGAMITHRNLVTNTLALQKVWKWTDSDVLLHVLPLFHIHGLCVALHGGLNAGSTLILHEKFDPQKSLKAIEEMKVTMFMAVPTVYFRFLEAWRKSKSDLSSMRVFISGSAPLSKELFEDFWSATGFRILERYGMTESQMITSNPYEEDRRIPGSVGYPLPGVQIRLVSESGNDLQPGEIGEVLIKGENVFKGYWQMPEKTRDSFFGEWFRSGDLGYQDEKDHMRLYLAGRSKELIISGGFNVYPKEVEDVLCQHESVREAAVTGISDKEYGEKVVAAVVLNKDSPPVTKEEIIAFCKERLVNYKCPKKVIFLSALPRNAMGKVQKHLTLQRNMG